MIKLVDLKAQHQNLQSELESAFLTVLEKEQFILGSQVHQLESAFADYHHCQYGIGVSNGTDALMIALKALNIREGDEVILPTMTFFATAEAVYQVGARHVLVDVEPETLGLEPILTEKAITANTKAIVPVHLHGWAVPLEPFLLIAQKYNLMIVEDCAQAHGASENGYPVGSRTQAGCFSFFPGKNLGALGDGGMITSNDEVLAKRMRALANHGRSEKYLHHENGYNARLDELQAAFLNVKFPHLETWNEQRRQLAQRYNIALAGLPLQLPPDWDEQCQPCFHLYVIHCEDKNTREQLANFLKNHEIQTGVHYPVPLHLQPALTFLGYEEGRFPVAEKAAHCILSLPIYGGMTDEQQDYVIEKIIQFFKG